MERRGCGLGCIVVGLGLLLSLCLLPYLISSIYTLVSVVFQVPVATTWLWGDWLNSMVGNGELYLLLAEGPMCCVGMIALLFVVLGAVVLIGDLGPREEQYDEELFDQDQYEAVEQPRDWRLE
jgi:hypothetical protein